MKYVLNQAKWACCALTFSSFASFASSQSTPQEPPLDNPICERVLVRAIDGTCNNVVKPRLGAAGIQLLRVFPSAYQDGLSQLVEHSPNSQLARKNPREISNIVAAQAEDMPSLNQLSQMVFQWGQFIDHDLDIDADINQAHGNGETVIIDQVLGDLFPAVHFERSNYDETTGIDTPREQMNHITAWLDGSMIYGSDIESANWLRSFKKGLLKTSTRINEQGEIEHLLPFNTVTGERFDELGAPVELDLSAPRMAGDTDRAGQRQAVFVAGDIRANEQTGLTAMHTLWVREHNRIAAMVWEQGYRDDEEIYQRTKRIVTGKIQKITYQDWLPALGIQVSEYQGYQFDVNPAISNTFAAAAFRFGHTMLPNNLAILQSDNSPATMISRGRVFNGEIPLINAFFNPELVAEYGANYFLKGLAETSQQQVDIHLVDAIRNLLFFDHTGTAIFGNDLAMLNIQRGRDHGLSDYVTIRSQVEQGSEISLFEEINDNPEIAAKLALAYDGDINNIDAWVGLIAESHQPGMAVGQTAAAIIQEQFERLRDADFYYYLNDPFIFAEDKVLIEQSSLSQVLIDNTGFSFNSDTFHH
ncbi:peroxidase [Catenovulum sp. SM1970]|uniref:peroxidase family protein n=1 Tax=Marinifaba aquimaris TaxID=2741323 RepID=UPI001573A7A5|nr:peroxidase family protein [Marinifaba aquimaris]NTS75558.1 peroxidase [Marinifaba aquimaris]